VRAGHLLLTAVAAAPRSTDELERAARERLSEAAWDFFRGGADDEQTLRWNREALARVPLWPRVCVDVSRRSLACTVLGQPIALPVLVAPVAMQRLAHPGGEPEAARGAHAAGTIFVAPTVATASLEEVQAASPGPKWFQLYPHRDRGLTRALVERARAAGYRALVVTLDTPLLGRRVESAHSPLKLPDGVTLSHLFDGEELLDDAARGARIDGRHDPSFGWRDLERVVAEAGLPVVAKGILRADDAARAIDAGVRAIAVSNHGGRQLDGAPAAIEALPRVAERAAGRVELMMDGGVRSGTDVVRALARGARAVMVGRPAMWGLAVGGAAGVAQLLALLGDELDRAMALCGCPTVESIGPDLLGPG
jgi:4-hydroxymandelate oxidase